jgi:thioredoxin 1
MAIDATEASFPSLVQNGNVLLDVWGPQCAPCIALMPAVEALEEKYGGRITLLKLNAPENRKLCRDLRIAGLPAYVTYRDGVEVERVTSTDVTLDHIEAAVERLLGGAPAKGLPMPEHLQ